MKTNTIVAFIAAGAIGVGVLALTGFSQNKNAATAATGANPDTTNIERGRYLVHQVALCIDCHSPRGEKGEFLPGKHLTGSPLGFTPTVPMPWMPVAPKLSGLPAGFTADDTVHFMMTGERPNGRPAVLPPMPPYRMNRADAVAITAYLQSLAPQAP